MQNARLTLTPQQLADAKAGQEALLFDGGEPTAQQRKALETAKRVHERNSLIELASAVPIQVYTIAADRDRKNILRTADRWALPIDSRSVNLWAVVKAFHDLLADNANDLHRLRTQREADDRDPNRKYRAAKAAQEELKLQRMRGEVVDARVIGEAIAAAAGVIREAGDQLQRLYGPEAADILDDACDEAEAAAKRAIQKAQQASADGLTPDDDGPRAEKSSAPRKTPRTAKKKTKKAASKPKSTPTRKKSRPRKKTNPR
jgi:phage terminase Nu1 subunit (DNA packaging protein)